MGGDYVVFVPDVASSAVKAQEKVCFRLEDKMRLPDLERDGWCLDDGEARQRAAPTTFQIPDEDIRAGLQPGDLAQLIFRIVVDPDDEEDPESVERMWVIVRERTETGYMGVLNNKPATIGENDFLWVGAELPFEARHIISARNANDASLKLALAPAPIPWRKDHG